MELQKVEDLEKTLDLYKEQIKEQLKLDDFCLKDKQLELPSNRHFWVGRLMQHKLDVIRLKRQKDKVFKRLESSKDNGVPVTLTESAKKRFQDHPAIVYINELIEVHELIIAFLEKTELNFRDTNYTVNNIIKIQQLETT